LVIGLIFERLMFEVVGYVPRLTNDNYSALDCMSDDYGF